MGVGGDRPGRRAAGIEQQDRLAAFGCLDGGARERSTVAEVLAVRRDQRCRPVPRQIGDHLGELEIGLVAERSEPGESEPVVRCELVQLEGEVPALRDDPDRTVCEVVDLELGRGVEYAQAVWPHEHGPGRANAITDRPLPADALLSGLAQPGAHHDDRSGTCREGVVDHLLERRGLDGHDDEVRRLLLGPGEGLAAGHRLVDREPPGDRGPRPRCC